MSNLPDRPSTPEAIAVRALEAVATTTLALLLAERRDGGTMMETMKAAALDAFTREPLVDPSIKAFAEHMDYLFAMADSERRQLRGEQ